MVQGHCLASVEGETSLTRNRVTGTDRPRFNNNADPLMVIELAYPSHRAAVAGSYNSITNVGSVVAAAVTFASFYRTGDWSWRICSLVQVIPTAIQWSLVMFGPESPRWLISKGRNEEALAILVEYHGDGDPQNPMVLYEFEEMKKSMVEEMANKKYGWTHLFRTRGMRKRSFTMMGLAISGQWCGKFHDFNISQSGPHYGRNHRQALPNWGSMLDCPFGHSFGALVQVTTPIDLDDEGFSLHPSLACSSALLA